MSSDWTRIAIAVTDSSQIRKLWHAAMRNVGESEIELLILFINDNRWGRAASLPFTREISRIGGSTSNFTIERANQVSKDTALRAERRVKKLAARAGLASAFKVLTEPDLNRIRELVGHGRTVLIAPTLLTGQPIYAQFEKLDCHIELIEITEQNHESQ